jgi:hypothetical protein
MPGAAQGACAAPLAVRTRPWETAAVDHDVERIRDQLSVLAEELADLALVRLREAVGEQGSGVDEPIDVSPAGIDERHLTRARRAIEKAVHLLEDRDHADDFDD